MQHPLLKLLPGAANLEARLTLLITCSVIIGLVLALLSLSEMFGRGPEGMDGGFKWVVLIAALALLFSSWVLWLVVRSNVLCPIEQIRQVLAEESKGGLGDVVDTVLEMREAIERAQAELDESNANMRQIERLAMVGKLAAGVAHSIRNPLTSVKLRLFSLERSLPLAPRPVEDLQVIADAIRHIDSVLTNFLEFSRRPKLSPQTIMLHDVVSASLTLLENRVATFPVSVRHDKAKLPSIHADPDQLREALLNILLNACDAMEYNGNLRVTERVTEQKGQVFACIDVQDSGPGMPSHVCDKLFIPFFSTKEQGTGLGLPIAKGILEEHGGDLLVVSGPQGGTTFTLLLPALNC